ncbi:hypothetical protein [Pseudoxanthomonas sp. JBR18]|uniref:terminase small subunit-like protein n=1 Tax=Pseudoxanthomonas sp. JBR18 TaxID=2969308 RepID=UPI002306125C|nr:hypothetical protein [Pseudoxanthomonas sp. JBR18]WCE04437.1 hypothetical protein PJ250_00035 [Pseudoxanthomonas sp. JBR18]
MTRQAKDQAPKSKGGRPSLYTPELADAICDAIAEGESLRQVCMRDGMPDRRTVERWMEVDASFAAKCARAREDQAEVHHDQMGEIEADVLSGALDPKAANVVLTNKRWRMEKLASKRYGQRLAVDHDVVGNLADRLKAARERTAGG